MSKNLFEVIPEDEWENGEMGRGFSERMPENAPDLAEKYGYDSVLDLKSSYFDSDEEKEEKQNILEKMTTDERYQYEHELGMIQEHMQTSSWITGLTEDEISEMRPNYFDGEELYKKKRIEFLSMFPEMEQEILPAESICFRNIRENFENKASAKNDSTNQIQKNAENILQNIVVQSNTNFQIGQFCYDDGKLKFLDDKKGRAFVIGNFWIEIQRECVHMHEICNEQNIIIDHKSESTWEIKIFCMGQIFEVEKTIEEILSEKKILKMTRDRGYLEAGGECRSLYKKYVNQLIAMNNYEKIYLYDSTGWTYLPDMGGWQYLTGEGVIGQTAYNVKADVPYHFYYKPEMVGSKEIFREFFNLRKLCQKGGKLENSIFLMHYSCLSTKTTFFQNVGKGINFIVALTGPTNSHKTSVGKVYARLYDRTDSALSDIRFNSTEVAIMEKMGMYGDSILMIDDFVPYSSKKQAQEQLKKFEIVIRSYGDREPRKRSKVYAKINNVPEYTPVKGCCLVTGEIFQTESESSDTRVVQLPFEPGDVDLELLTHYQQNLLIFPTFFYDYICYTRENIPLLLQIIEEEFRKIRGQICCRIKTPRFVDTFAIMSLEVRFFYDYAVQREYLSINEAQKYFKKDMQMIMSVILRNDQDSKAKSPATIICLALEWALQTREKILCQYEKMKAYKNFSEIVGEDEEYFYILPETLWQIYKEYCKNCARDLIYKNGRELSAPLRKENILFTKLEGKGEKQRATHKIGSFTTKRFFKMRKQQILKLVEPYEIF